jgi:hypothetical protein
MPPCQPIIIALIRMSPSPMSWLADALQDLKINRIALETHTATKNYQIPQ